jgi:hypothetical protein
LDLDVSKATGEPNGWRRYDNKALGRGYACVKKLLNRELQCLIFKKFLDLYEEADPWKMINLLV